MQLNKNTCKIAMEKSISNAQSLFSDAELLEKNDRIERAFTLYLFVVEELSKYIHCIGFIYTQDFNDKGILKAFKRLFSDHIFKIEESSHIDQIIIRILDKAHPTIGEKYKATSLEFTKKAKLLNDLKNESLYTSYKDNSFSNPNDAINKSLLSDVKIFADLRLQALSLIHQPIIENFDELNTKKLKNKDLSNDKLYKIMRL